MTRGRFVVLEGGEATGKSTQAALLAERLGAMLTREPGGTEVGERVREIVLDPALDVSPRAEALLMAAARAQHVASVIEPALAAGRDVVSDRFTGSSLAYQGLARELGVEAVASLSEFATGGLVPDLVVLLDMPPEVARKRRMAAPDRMEAETPEFHEAVAVGFRALAEMDPGRWVVVDASGSIDTVADHVWAEVERR